LDEDLARAATYQIPALILVAETGASQADDDALFLFPRVVANLNDGVAPIVLDLSLSRNRALAARFHANNTPLLLGLTPRGLIVTRDGGPITKGLVFNRMGKITERRHELDGQLATLEEEVAKAPTDAAAQLRLADFLIGQSNAREALPHFEAVARDNSTSASVRVRAWVEVARAHFWMAEPEKGRHSAQELIAALGPVTSEALAGGNLMLGVQDANARRFALARRELAAAMAAAPDSDYARQAGEALAKFQGEAK